MQMAVLREHTKDIYLPPSLSALRFRRSHVLPLMPPPVCVLTLELNGSCKCGKRELRHGHFTQINTCTHPTKQACGRQTDALVLTDAGECLCGIQ